MVSISSVQILPSLSPQSDKNFVIFAGSGTKANLAGFIKLSVEKPIKRTRVTLQFRGVCNVGRCNPEELACVTDGSVSMPFLIELDPSHNIPPSFYDKRGNISYSIKVSISYTAQHLSLSRNLVEEHVPVVVLMPHEFRQFLLSSPPVVHKTIWDTTKCAVKLDIPFPTVTPSEIFVVNVQIDSIPHGRSLRYVDASLRTTMELQTSSGVEIHELPRPLGEDRFIPTPLYQGKITSGWASSFHIAVDPLLARESVNSPLIEIKTVFRLEVVLDDSSTPNVLINIPIQIVYGPDDDLVVRGDFGEGLHRGSSSLNHFLMNANKRCSSVYSANNSILNYERDSISSLTAKSADITYTSPSSSPDLTANYNETAEYYQAIKEPKPYTKKQPSTAEAKLDDLMNELSLSGGLQHSTRIKQQQQQPPSTKLSEQYRAIRSYKPENNDEIELLLGDIVVVKKKYADGWAWTYNLSSMMEGLVPLDAMCEPMF